GGGGWDGPKRIKRARAVFMGLALTAHNNDGRLNPATFDNVTVTPPAVLTHLQGGEASSIFTTQRVPVTGTFNTSFVMNVRPANQTNSADGITFTLQTAGSSALGGAGGGLGFSGISPSVGIKFDLYSQGTHNST